MAKKLVQQQMTSNLLRRQQHSNSWRLRTPPAWQQQGPPSAPAACAPLSTHSPLACPVHLQQQQQGFSAGQLFDPQHTQLLLMQDKAAAQAAPVLMPQAAATPAALPAPALHASAAFTTPQQQHQQQAMLLSPWLNPQQETLVGCAAPSSIAIPAIRLVPAVGMLTDAGVAAVTFKASTQLPPTPSSLFAG